MMLDTMYGHSHFLARLGRQPSAATAAATVPYLHFGAAAAAAAALGMGVSFPPPTAFDYSPQALCMAAAAAAAAAVHSTPGPSPVSRVAVPYHSHHPTALHAFSSMAALSGINGGTVCDGVSVTGGSDVVVGPMQKVSSPNNKSGGRLTVTDKKRGK